MQFVYTKQAFKTLKKLNKYTQKQIASYVEELEKLDNPRQRGKALTSNLAGLWRYRVGDYRLICKIEEGEMLILCLLIGHRSSIYQTL